MNVSFGPRTTHLLTAWGDVAATHPTGPGYDLTPPTRSELHRDRLETFVDDPTESTFEFYFGHNLDPEEVERMRQAVADLEYVTEAYLVELCEGTEPWARDDDHTPSWQSLDE